MEGDSYTLPVHSLSLTLGAQDKESWAKSAVTVDEDCNSIGSHDGKVIIYVVMYFSSFISASLHAKFAYILHFLIYIKPT